MAARAFEPGKARVLVNTYAETGYDAYAHPHSILPRLAAVNQISCRQDQ